MNKSYIWPIILLALLSSGCTSIVRAEQALVMDALMLDGANSLGQTFTANFDGMNGLEIYLEPLEAGAGQIELTLRSGPQSENLGVSNRPLSEITAPGFYHFPLPLQADSNQQNYFLRLRISGEGRLKVGAAPGETYLRGALYQNGAPNDQRQMAFQISYAAPRLLLGLAGEVLLWGWYLAAGAFLFVLPGWALLGALPSPRTPLPVGEGLTMRSFWVKLGLSVGIGLAIYPILFLWTDILGLHLGRWYAWLPPLVGAAVLFWQAVTGWKDGVPKIRRPSFRLADIVLLLIIGLIVATRFWAIRALPMPLWGDSYHHTMISQLLINNRGLFESWQPYADAITFTYHFGFHTLVSSFHWVTNIPAAQATLLVGQIVNVLAVLALYPLAIMIFKNPWSGTAAVLVAGLLSPMPMFYVNWGRYTQLTGQVLLLVAVWLSWAVLTRGKRNAGLIALTCLVVGSLALTHYRIIIFYVIFLIAFLLIHADKKMLWPRLQAIFWVGIGAGIIFLPWFVNVFGGRILRIFQGFLTNMPAPAGSGGSNTVTHSLGDLTLYLPIALWLLMTVMLAICLWQRKREIAVVGLWWFLLVLAANPHWLGLPGKGIIDNFSIFIAAYIPAGLILAAIPAGLATSPQPGISPKAWVNRALAISLVCLGIWGAWKIHGVVNPHQFALAVEPDLRAAEWIEGNIPKEARFLVNTFFAYGGTVIVGSDGGWWLPLIAGRDTTLPPMTYGFEREPFVGYNQWVQVPTRMIEQYGITHPITLATLAEYGVTHVYIGQQQGSVNYAGPLSLDPAVLQSDPHFKPVYHQDRVWVFEFVP